MESAVKVQRITRCQGFGPNVSDDKVNLTAISVTITTHISTNQKCRLEYLTR